MFDLQTMIFQRRKDELLQLITWSLCLMWVPDLLEPCLQMRRMCIGSLSRILLQKVELLLLISFYFTLGEHFHDCVSIPPWVRMRANWVVFMNFELLKSGAGCDGWLGPEVCLHSAGNWTQPSASEGTASTTEYSSTRGVIVDGMAMILAFQAYQCHTFPTVALYYPWCESSTIL